MRNSRYKLRGIMLITTVVAVAAWILLAGGIFLTQSSQFQMLGARKIEEQARQYAEVDAQVLKKIPYTDLENETILKNHKLHLKRAHIESVVADENWEDEIIIGKEQTSSDKNNGKYRIAVINVYRKDDKQPRKKIKLLLVQKSSNSAKSFIGGDVLSSSLNTDFAVFIFPYFEIGVYPESASFFYYVVYDLTKSLVDRVYPFHGVVQGASPHQLPYAVEPNFVYSQPTTRYFDGDGRQHSMVDISFNKSEFSNWFQKYKSYIKNDISKKIEAANPQLKSQILHSDSYNATFVYSTDCVYITYRTAVSLPAMLFKSDFTISRLNDVGTTIIASYSNPILKGNDCPQLETIKNLLNLN